MGLDMYLEVRKRMDSVDYEKSVGGEPYYNPEVGEVLTTAGLASVVPKSYYGIYVQATVMYWRKMNAIHNWFVENCADGVDECQQIYVSNEKAWTLFNTIVGLLQDKDQDKAHASLPTTSGFFFGGTEYDEYYFEELERTKDELGHLLNNIDERTDIIYQASW